MNRLPSKDEILDWIRENPQAAGKREIARAFNIKSGARVELKALLRELEDEGHIARRKRRVRPAGHLPPVTVLIVDGPDPDGDLRARPKEWDDKADAPPPITLMPRKGDAAFGPGDHVLAKLHPVQTDDHLSYQARPIKRLGAGPKRMLGVFRAGPEASRVVPVEKGADKEWIVRRGDEAGAEDGELVEVEATSGPRFGLPHGRVAARLGDPGAPKQVSLIAMHEHGIPYEFPPEVIAEAEHAKPVDKLGNREDLRDLPLVTIDPEDARDHDDAVCAFPDDDKANKGGWIVWVAIADVAWYVRHGSELDREAWQRGNSTYFPDRVAPMLPEKLSADLCSLIDGVDRPCLAVRMVLNARGEKIDHRFTRGLMRSRFSLSYGQAQAAADGDADAVPEEIRREAVEPVFAAWRAAHAARERRQPLDLDLPERRIELDEEGRVTSVRIRERLDAHRVIEEFMILANVAAAEALEERRSPLIYRVHEEPNPEKLDALRETVETVGLTLAKGQVLQTRHLNDLLRAVEDSEHREMINLAVLRSQTQAYYARENFAHFGLNLRAYAHFTSPIRRYADLIVHRALISALRLGPGGLERDEIERIDETAEHISVTERRSMAAERDTVDRYLAAFLADRVGAEFTGRISGVQRFGLFVKLDESGADGLVPISTIGREYFRFDADSQTLTGERSGRILGVGQPVTVRLVEAEPVSGGLILEILSVEGEPARRPSGARPGKRQGPSGRRKLPRERIARTKAARKAKRKR